MEKPIEQSEVNLVFLPVVDRAQRELEYLFNQAEDILPDISDISKVSESKNSITIKDEEATYKLERSELKLTTAVVFRVFTHATLVEGVEGLYRVKSYQYIIQRDISLLSKDLDPTEYLLDMLTKSEESFQPEENKSVIELKEPKQRELIREFNDDILLDDLLDVEDKSANMSLNWYVEDYKSFVKTEEVIFSADYEIPEDGQFSIIELDNDELPYVTIEYDKRKTSIITEHDRGDLVRFIEKFNIANSLQYYFQKIEEVKGRIQDEI